MRDFQVSTVYRAEAAYTAAFPSHRLKTSEECDRFIQQVLQHHKVLRRYGKFTVKVLDNPRLVKTGRAIQEKGYSTIELPPLFRNQHYCLHETAHVLLPDEKPFHSPVFCSTLVQLTRWILGRIEADRLMDYYDKFGVDYD